MRPAKPALALFVSLLAFGLSGCVAMRSQADSACPISGQKEMTLVRLYFGRDIAGRAPLSDEEWSRFAASVLTPQFPDGLTVFKANGQWMDTDTNHVVLEDSIVVEVAVEAHSDLQTRIDRVVEAYKQQFHQQAVGVLSQTACARF